MLLSRERLESIIIRCIFTRARHKARLSEIRYFEPNQIQYLPVRSDSLDIIETQVAEVDGKLVEFSPGVTTVTLHFKHE